ncbi:transcription antitermination factor NusB [Derxia gummosa]|uniref:Transcription antitermination protein NusB n=1 Tax=Derxia gummosa DSM 723 TaxID=1121388 RepID=A0A8B6X783_9BURK|nr:transcription antitermination factor NusB [Derxia gummosa]
MTNDSRTPGAPQSGAREGRPAGGPPKSARRRAREFALQGVYQWLLSSELPGAIQAHVADQPGFDKADAEYFSLLLHGAINNADQLRGLFAPHLDRAVGELSPVEHAVLLLGSRELAAHAEVPYRVVINESVELAKSFGGTDGFRFVNGVLDKVAAGVRPTEFKPRNG